jgi:uncharacterized membrane protein
MMLPNYNDAHRRVSRRQFHQFTVYLVATNLITPIVGNMQGYVHKKSQGSCKIVAYSFEHFLLASCHQHSLTKFIPELGRKSTVSQNKQGKERDEAV